MHLTQVYPVCHLCAKNFHSWWKFDKVLRKITFHSFFRQGVRTYVNVYDPFGASLSATHQCAPKHFSGSALVSFSTCS